LDTVATSGLGSTSTGGSLDKSIFAATTNDSILEEAVGVVECGTTVKVGARVGGRRDDTIARSRVKRVARSAFVASAVNGRIDNVASFALANKASISSGRARDGVAATWVRIARVD